MREQQNPYSIDDVLGITDTETPERADWKELLPIYGLFQIARDESNRKPTLINAPTTTDNQRWIYVVYQYLSISATAAIITYGPEPLIDFIKQFY